MQMRAQGFKIFEAVLSRQEAGDLVSTLHSAGEFAYRPDMSGTTQPLLAHSGIGRFAKSPELMRLARDALGACPAPYQAVMLDKSLGANWELDWHQDTRIPVNARIDVPGYANWTLEAGIDHVVPPAEVLASCVSLRVHLDDCDRHNGALEVIPGSHLLGLIGPAEVRAVAHRQLSRHCEVASGGIMVMSPLLVHRSPPSQVERPRRVLQINYQACSLVGGLKWWG